MTITVVPSVPTHSELQKFDVDNSITGRHVGEMINNTSFLLGKNVANIVCSFPALVPMALNSIAPITYYFAEYQWFYTRSPDVQFVNLETECWKSTFQALDTGAYDITISASLPAGATWLNSDSEGQMVNNVIQDDWSGNLDFRSTRNAIINVSALSTTTPSLFTIRATGVNGTAGAAPQTYRPGGISKINMQEIPLRFLNVSQAGQSGSSDIISTVPFRRIVDGSATTEFGLARMLDQTKKAQTRVRNQWQIINHQSTQPIINPDPFSGLVFNQTTIWSSDSAASAPLDFKIPGDVDSGNVFYIRTRNYRGVPFGGAVNYYNLYVRYRTQLALPATGISLSLNYSSEPNSISGVATVNLPASTVWTTETIGLDFPCDEWIMQREQLVRINFTVAGAGAGQTVYVSALYLVENE